MEDTRATNFMLFNLHLYLGFVYREVGKNAIPTYLVLYQDPFWDLLNHEDRPKAGPRGSASLKNDSEICYVFAVYLPRGNKSPNKPGHQIRQPPISTNLVIRICWPTYPVIYTIAQFNGDDASSGDCPWEILEPLIP